MRIKQECILSIQKTLLGSVLHEVAAQRLGNGWNIRVYANKVLNQEVRVWSVSHIGPVAREMLRTEDKCGNISEFSTAARERLLEEDNV